MARITVVSYLMIFSYKVLQVSSSKDCKTLSNIKADELSVIYSEHSGGLASQLLIYAMLRQLRQDFYLNAYMSRHCYETLAQVFTEKSIQDVPIFEDTFCKTPQEVPFETYAAPMTELLTNKELHYGKILWLFPSNKALHLDENYERLYGEYR